MGTPTASAETPSTPSSSSSGGNNSGSSKTNANVIAGSAYQSFTRHPACGIHCDGHLKSYRFLTGVVGGVVALATLAVLAFFLKMRAGRGNAANVILGPDPLTNPNMTDHTYAQPKSYDPADPSTFPHFMSNRDSSHMGAYTSNPHQPGRYSGAAEI